MAYKRQSRKFGSGRITTTTSSNGHIRTTISSGSKQYRTSFSYTNNGKSPRQTVSTNQDGWISRTSKSLGPDRRRSKSPSFFKSTRRRGRKRTSSSSFGLFEWLIVLIILAWIFG